MKKERGSITVEAALFLPVFLMAFLTIYNLVYFARAQMLMQYAADQAAYAAFTGMRGDEGEANELLDAANYIATRFREG